MSLTTPDKIRTLQRKLYLKAKAEPNFRFYLLYDKVYRADILRHAYNLARANKGAPGVDGVDFAAIEAAGLENWLDGIETELRTKTYQPQPVRRVMIPKPGGGERPLGAMHGRNTSTSWVTASDRTTTGRTATGIWARVHHGRACNASSREWGRSWSPPMLRLVRTRLNNLRGWATYFSYGTRLMAYRAADHHVYEAVRGFLTRRHKVPSRGTRQSSDPVVFGKLGVLRLRRMHIGAPPTGAR